MFKKLNLSKKVITIGATLAILCVIVYVATPLNALSLMDVVDGSLRGEGQPAELFGSNTAIIPRAINLMLFATGVLAIFMMIYGGLRYVLSAGDGGKVKDAKNTILYAIIGLVVAILGYAIVNWVIQIVGSGAISGSAII